MAQPSWSMGVRSTWWRDEAELDEQQLEVVRLELDEESVLVTGQPGSGKTNLALLRAKFLVLAGLPNTVVLTVGRVISNFIYAGAQLHGLDEDNVQTFHQWGRRLVLNAGGELPKTDDYDEFLALLVDQLKQLAADGKLETFDAIILDEAQDFPTGCAAIFRAVTDRLFVTGDERQRIFDGTSKTLAEFKKNAHIIELEHHYRNGLEICKFAGALKGYDYAASSLYDEDENPSSFERHRYDSTREQVLHAAREIPNQLDAYPDDLVGIMVPQNSDLDEIIDILEDTDLSDRVQIQSSKHGYARLDPQRRVIALTMSSAKGLEFRSAHWLAVDSMTSWRDSLKLRNLVFTAATRAKTSLSIYHAENLKPWLESAILKVTSVPTAPQSLGSLFPKAGSS